MLLANNFTFLFTPSPKSVVQINEGTGAFAGAHGTYAEVDLPNGNANITLRTS